MDLWYRQAYDLLAAPEARRAFDLTREPAAVRDRYGRYRSGQACLLARRLVEAGVPLVDNVGPEVFRKVSEGTQVRLHDGTLYVGSTTGTSSVTTTGTSSTGGLPFASTSSATST